MAAAKEEIPNFIKGFTSFHNYKAWEKEFENVAKKHGLWTLCNGEEQIKAEPEEKTYVAEMKKAKTAFMQVYWKERLESDRWEYDQQRHRVLQALSLIYDSLDPVIRNGLRIYSFPHEAWNAITSTYGIEPRPWQIALGHLVELHLKDCVNFTDFFDRLFFLVAAVNGDGRREGLNFSEGQIKLKIFTAMTAQYAPAIWIDFDLQFFNNMTLVQMKEFFLSLEQQVPHRVIVC